MANFSLIALCLILGIVLRASRRLPVDSHVAFNSVIVNVALPALTFASVRKFTFDPSLAFAVAMPWIVFAIGAVFFLRVSRMLGFDRPTTGALLLTGALGNTSFLGLPMIETFYGRDALHIGLLIDQLGSYLILSTVGLAAAASLAGKSVSTSQMAWRMLKFPPFQALLLTLATAQFALPPWVDSVLSRLGEAIPMLAMLSIGCQLRVRDVIGNRRALAVGLGFKLLLVPGIIAILYLGLLPSEMRHTVNVTIFESAMAPMIGGAIVAVQYQLNAPLTGLMVGVGIPLSLITAPAWWYLTKLLPT